MNGNKLHFCGMLSQNKQGQIWVQDPVSGNYHEMDDIGGWICRYLKNPCTFEELVYALTEEYDVDEVQCARDVQPFVEALLKNGLVKEEKA